jgi:hypothetical protein
MLCRYFYIMFDTVMCIGANDIAFTNVPCYVFSVYIQIHVYVVVKQYDLEIKITFINNYICNESVIL